MKNINNKIIYSNRSIYKFQLIDEFEAGMILESNYIKNIRLVQCNFEKSFVLIAKHNNKYKATLKSCNIKGILYNIVLLLNKSEIKKLYKYQIKSSYTIIVKDLYIVNNKIKALICLCKFAKNILKDKGKKRNNIIDNTDFL